MRGRFVYDPAAGAFAPAAPVYRAGCPINRTDDGEAVRVEACPVLNYAAMTDYIRSWPDKLVSFVAARLCDDDMRPFARELYGYICEADHDGPDFEEWNSL